MNANASGASNRPKFIKKLTPKSVTDTAYGPGFLTKVGETRPVPAQELYKLFGQISRVKTGTTNLGDYIQFKGRFRAVTKDGEIFDGGAAHIPVLEDMLFTVLSEAQSAVPKAVVEISVSIGIKPATPGKPSATGYEYEVTNLRDVQEASDPISRLMSEAGIGGAAALPAPTPVSQLAAVAEPVATAEPVLGGRHHAGGKRR
jgi:hypothetical protein